MSYLQTECEDRARELRRLVQEWNATRREDHRAMAEQAAGTLERAGAALKTHEGGATPDRRAKIVAAIMEETRRQMEEGDGVSLYADSYDNPEMFTLDGSVNLNAVADAVLKALDG